VSQLTPEEVWEYYLAAQEAFSAYHRQLQSGIGPSGLQRVSQFVGMTGSEIDREFEKMSEELGLQVALGLVAAVEAVLMLDYQKRMEDGIKNALYARLIILWKRPTRATLDEILEAWKDANPGTGDVIGRFKQVVGLRHWMAHGRYWHPQGFKGLDASAVVDRARAMERGLRGAMPALITW
jgi:hypothetical protein